MAVAQMEDEDVVTDSGDPRVLNTVVYEAPDTETEQRLAVNGLTEQPEDNGVADPVYKGPPVTERAALCQRADSQNKEPRYGEAPNPVCEWPQGDSEVAELRHRAQSLKQELEECKAELNKLQKQLSQSERLQRSTESYNEDLRRQVEQLSAELHERKRKDKEKTDSETQTEEYAWTDTGDAALFLQLIQW